MKEAVTKVFDTLIQEDFHGAFQKFLERHNKCIAAGGDLLRRGLEFHVCTINKRAHTKKNLETYRMHLVKDSVAYFSNAGDRARTSAERAP